MTEEDISNFEKNHIQLKSLHDELSNLSKKSSNDALNKFKLKLVNKAINVSNEILGNKYKPFSDFNEFLEDEMPTNSDVTLVIGQYLNCMEKLRADNIGEHYGEWYWRSNKNVTNIRTSPPQKISNK